MKPVQKVRQISAFFLHLQKRPFEFLCFKCVNGFTDSNLLPLTNEVWNKVIFSEACVKNYVHRGCLVPGGSGLVWSGPGVMPGPGGSGPRGVPGPRGVSRPTTKGEVEEGSGPGPHPRGKLGGTGQASPLPTATAAGGTHTTGMHSCFFKI